MHYPLSSPQVDIWLDQLLHPDMPLYHIGGYVRFEASLNRVIADREALRTRLHDAVRGGAAMFDGDQPLNMEESGNHNFLRGEGLPT